MDELQIGTYGCIPCHPRAQLPIDFLYRRRIKNLRNGGTILSLVAILDHSLHTLLVEWAFKKDCFYILDQLGEGLPKTIWEEMGRPYKERGLPIFFDSPYRPQMLLFPPEKRHLISQPLT